MSSTQERPSQSTNAAGRPLEKHVTAAILKYLNKLPGCYASKTYGSAYRSGQPDIIGSLAGQAFAIEVKRPKIKPEPTLQTRAGWHRAGATPLQVATLEKWQQAGALTGVVASVDEAREVLGVG